MKTFSAFTQFILITMSFSLFSMEQAIIYKQACLSDVPNIVNLINTKATEDSKKIVILPKKYRPMATEANVKNNKLYCAIEPTHNAVIAFKKLFIIDNEEEYNEITQDEIRCSGKKSNFINAKKIDCTNPTLSTAIEQHKLSSFSFKTSMPIYFGGDYTSPDGYRDKGINSHLTRYAYTTIQESVISKIKTNNLQELVLFYGLTKANAGETSDGIDRTPSIIRNFLPFAQQVQTKCFSHKTELCNALYHSRYEAFMPTFDPEDNECKPLPDDQSIPGYGNVLIFSLNNNFQ